MALLDLEKLLEPNSPEHPCGESLEYDALFVAIESASRGKAEQQYGDNIIPAEPPDWAEVVRIGLMLVEQTKDLRVGCFLARGLLATQGLEPFTEGLSLVRGYLDQHWDTVHPQLEDEDGRDPTFRVNTLSSLNDFDATITELRAAPLVEAGVIGRFSLLDLEVAKGESPWTGEDEPPTLANIEAAFEAVGAESLLAKLDAANLLMELVTEIESRLTSQVGTAHAISFEPLAGAAAHVHAALKSQAKRLGLDQPEPETGGGDSGDSTGVAGEPAAASASGEIRSRQDVIRTIDRLCQYYEVYEPSSPLPLLLQRAKRLVPMSFLDIIKDLTPDALLQAQSVGGVGANSSPPSEESE